MTRKRLLPFAPAYQLDVPPRAELRNYPLRGRRVKLSPVEPADGPEIWTAVETSRDHLEEWLPWVPFNNSPEASQRYAEACASDWDAGRSLRFTIRAHRGQLYGVVSLDNCVHLHRNCDLGYWLDARATGRGYLTEAADLCIEFAFHRLGMHRIRCAAAIGNQKSLNAIARLGFQHEGIARAAEFLNGRFVDHVIFARLSTDPSPVLGS